MFARIVEKNFEGGKMEKQLIIGIAFLFICVGLSGCNEQSSIENDYVEISNVNVVTTWQSAYGESGEHDGLYHDYPENSFAVYYVVTGAVTNIADKLIDKVTVKAKFYDNKNNYIASESDLLYGLYLDESQNFRISLGNYETNYFEQISEYELSITDVEFH